MLAHAMGLGLYEGNDFILWLKDSEWELFGYLIERVDNKLILKRNNLRRFEEVDDTYTNIDLIGINKENIIPLIIDLIKKLINEHPSIKPDDIAIIFLEQRYDKEIQDTIEDLIVNIEEEISWGCTKLQNTKSQIYNTISITNINNIKGLEFPFVICVELGTITSAISKRNAIYMALTRSFITSYFLVNEINASFIETYSKALEQINKDNCMILEEPSQEAKIKKENKFKINLENKKMSFDEFFDKLCADICGKYSDHINIESLIQESENKEYLFDSIHNFVKLKKININNLNDNEYDELFKKFEMDYNSIN